MAGELLPALDGCEFTVTRPTLIDEANFTSNVPYYAAPAWVSGTPYGVGAFIYYSGSFYTRTSNNGGTSSDAPSVSARWAVNTTELLLAPWDVAATYAIGDKRAVSYTLGAGVPNASDIYISKTNSNIGNDPTTSTANWAKLGTVYWPYIPDTGGGDGTIDLGERRIFQRRVYEALVLNPQNTPGGNNPPTAPSLWLDVGPSNKWAMLDELTSTQTTMPIDIVTTTQVTGRINTLGLLGLRGTTVNVTIMDGMTEVYNEDFSLLATDEIYDWWTYYYADVSYKSSLFIRDLPAVLNPTVIVTVSAGSGYDTRAIGQMVIGAAFVIGLTEKGSTVGIENYDRINTDEFGTRTIIKRGYSDIGTFKVMIDNVKVDAVKRILTDLRGTPSLYVASSAYDSTAYFGIASFDIGFEYAYHSRANISVNGY